MTTKQVEVMPKFYVSRVPKFGDVGPEVKVLQNRLKDAGFSPGKVDGDFGKATRTAAQKFQKSIGLKGTGVLAGKTLAALNMEVGEGDGLAERHDGKPSVMQVVAVVIGMIEGTVPTKAGPYKVIRETKGNNRSAEIDALIKRQGGSLGQPYCQYGQQEILDELCAYYKISRKAVKIPEGGGTQGVFSGTPEKYKRKEAAPLCWITWKYSASKGHIGICLTNRIGGSIRTFEFNTTARGAEVVRDGQGAGYCKRTGEDQGTMKLRGYIDVYAALMDAWPA